MISTKKKAPNFDVNIMMKIFIHKFYSNENTFLEKKYYGFNMLFEVCPGYFRNKEQHKLD